MSQEDGNQRERRKKLIKSYILLQNIEKCAQNLQFL